MTIDTNALRRFQELWDPVMKAIPAVLDAAERQADLDRGISAKKIELDRIQAEIAETVAKAEHRVKSLNADALAALERKQATQKEISEARAAAAQQAAADAQQQQQALSSAQAKVASVESQLQSLQADYAAKRAAAEAEHAKVVRQLDEEIAQLKARKTSAEQALRDIKAKLG